MTSRVQLSMRVRSDCQKMIQAICANERITQPDLIEDLVKTRFAETKFEDAPRFKIIAFERAGRFRYVVEAIPLGFAFPTIRRVSETGNVVALIEDLQKAVSRLAVFYFGENLAASLEFEGPSEVPLALAAVGQ